MTIKQQVINESIKRITKRLDEIDFILNASPLTDIIKLRHGAQGLLEANKGESRLSPEFAEKISKLAKKEKQLFELSKQQYDSVKLIEEKVKLHSELSSLNSELFYMDKNNFK